MAGKQWVAQTTRKPRFVAFSDVYWLPVFAMAFIVGGLVQGIIGAYFENWYAMAFALINEFAALNLYLLSTRGDE